MPDRRLRRLLPGVTVGLVCGVLTGCVGIPTSGSVHVGRALPGSAETLNDQIRVLPAPPRANVTPRELVTGFLQALVYPDQGFGIAREYLAPGVQWRPSTTVTTYDGVGLRVRQVARQTVEMTAPRVGMVNARGEYTLSPGTVQAQFRIVRSLGQWRISRLPAQVLLSTFDAQRTLKPATVYYLNRQGNRLVPDQLLLDVPVPGLATTLVRAVLAGPDAPLSAVTRSAAPPKTQLVTNVAVDGSGVAQVNLSGSVRTLPASALTRLSAQLVWTLRQIPAIKAMQLLVEGRPLTVPGVPSLQPLSSWPGYDPDVSSLSTVAVAVRDGRPASIAGSLPAALNGLRGVQSAALSLDRDKVAVLSQAGRSLRLQVGPAGGPLRTVAVGPVTATPAFDPRGDLLVGTAVRAGSPLRLVTATGAVRTVRMPASLLGAAVDAVRVSRDGARVALIVGQPPARELVVALLVPTRRSYALRSPHVVLPSKRDAAGLAWTASEQLVTTGVIAGGRRAVYTSDPDGYQPQPLSLQLLPGDVDQVAAAPGRPVLASNGRGIWTLLQTWRRTSTGGAPTYTG